MAAGNAANRVGYCRYNCLRWLVGCTSAIEHVEGRVDSSWVYRQEIFKNLRGYPWRLCDGDARERLHELGKYAVDLDETSSNIRSLVLAGYNETRLCDGIDRLRQCAFSTSTQEQGHGSAASLHKFHKQYGRNVLMGRSVVHTMTPLIQRSDHEKFEEQTKSNMRKLQSNTPEASGGRQEFYKEAVARAKATFGCVGDKLPQEMMQTLMRRHASQYRALSAKEKREYESRAEDSAQVKRQKLDADISTLAKTAESRRQALLDNPDECQRVRVCRLSDEDIKSLSRMYNSDEFGYTNMLKLREKAMVAPEPPSYEQKVAIDRVIRSFKTEERRNHRAWVADLCRYREHFEETAMKFRDVVGTRYFLFLYATQTPFAISFLALEPRRQAIFFEANAWQVQFEGDKHEFDAVVPDTYVTDEELPYSDEALIDVLREVVLTEGSRVCSSADFIKLPDFLAAVAVGPQPQGKRGGRRAAGQEQDEEIVEPSIMGKFPWLSSLGVSGSASSSTAWPTLLPSLLDGDAGVAEVDPKGKADDGKQRSLTAKLIDADVVDEVFETMRKKRDEWADARPLASLLSSFRVNVVGGAWCKANIGETLERFRAQAVGRHAENFCARYGLQKQATFNIRKYGENTSAALAQGWPHRMDYFYSCYRDVDDVNFQFSKEYSSNFTETDEFAKLANCADVAVSSRVMQIRSIVPTLPLC